jgi:hypothetical protein
MSLFLKTKKKILKNKNKNLSQYNIIIFIIHFFKLKLTNL